MYCDESSKLKLNELILKFELNFLNVVYAEADIEHRRVR